MPTPYLYAAILAIGLITGWTANGWRLNGDIADMKLEASQAALEAVQAMKAKSDKIRKSVTEIDTQKTKELNHAKAEINRMRQSVADGSGWLQFNARCPSVSGLSIESGLGNGTAPKLDATAQQSYFLLREGIELCRKQVEFFQDKERAIQNSQVK